MTLIKDADDLDRLVQESEAIARGESPDMAGTGGPAPAASDNGAGALSEEPAPASYSEIADFGLLLINAAYVIAFGPRAVLPAELHHEAKRNLELICAKYLPATVADLGPGSALLGILAIHTFNCYRWRTTALSPESSASAEAGSQP